MTENAAAETQEFTYQAEMQQLLELIIHSLYQHKDIFLRELISNASDALNKVRFKKVLNEDLFDADAELAIALIIDEEAKTLTVRDSGLGMTREELIENLGTIARSGTKAFLKQLQDSDSEQRKELIGQFGVGFYSAFMVADRIEVVTRSANPDAQAWRWSSDGGSAYTIESAERETRGTDIILHLKEDEAEFAEEYRVRGIVRKYSHYVSYPIRLGEEQINETQAIWTRNKADVTDEEYKEFYRYATGRFDEPLAHIHSSVETPVQYHALLYIPSTGRQDMLHGKDNTNIKLYCRKVFVHDQDTGLLPAWLRFVSGVVDSEDLPLNVSREVVQSNPIARKISKSLTNKVLSEVERIAEKEPETYATLWKEFGRVLKEGLHSDLERKERLTELMRFETSTQEAGSIHSLAAYVERMPEAQPQVYFVSGETRAAALRNPKLELFKKHNVEVLLLLDPIDEIVLSSVPTYKEKPLVELDQADISWLPEDEDKPEPAPEGEVAALIACMKEALGEAVEDVRVGERLIDSPCALVAGENAMSRHFEKMMKLMNDDFTASKRVLEINPRSAIIRALAKRAKANPSDALVADAAHHLLGNIQLLEGELADPSELVRRSQAFLEIALEAQASEG